jgi:hypothetical protein
VLFVRRSHNPVAGTAGPPVAQRVVRRHPTTYASAGAEPRRRERATHRRYVARRRHPEGRPPPVLLVVVVGDDMLLVTSCASRRNVTASSARSRRPEGLRLVASPASTPLGAPSMTDDTVVCHVESHTRANSDTRRRRNREDGGASSPQWVRAPTISHLPWGLVPFDACRSEQRPTPGFQPRLCGAFRLSRPLDASFRSQPLRPCFMPVTPLGFRFRRFPLLDNRQ